MVFYAWCWNLDGEIVQNCVPDIGFLHTGIEKNMEAKTYQKAEVMTDRMDYMNTVGNNLAYCLAIEKLCDLDVPARAQSIRVVLTELQRIASHLLWMGTSALDLAAMSVFLYAMREREMIMDILELVSGQRMMTTYIRPGGLWRDVPVEFDSAVRKFTDILPGRIDEYEFLSNQESAFPGTDASVSDGSARKIVSAGGSQVQSCAVPVWLMTCENPGHTPVMNNMNLIFPPQMAAISTPAIQFVLQKCVNRSGSSSRRWTRCPLVRSGRITASMSHRRDLNWEPAWKP